MKRNAGAFLDPQTLRQRAEARHRENLAAGPGEAGGETEATYHELKVHQIELEMQNEELRRVQARLSVSRARYFDLYDGAPVGYCTLNQAGEVLEANRSALALLGIGRRDILTRPITQFILPADQDTYYLHRKRFRQSEGPHSCELRMVRRGGGDVWVQLTTVEVPATLQASGDEAGDMGSIRLVLNDIRELKASEEARNDLALKLERSRRLESIGLLSAGIAHVFNNLLTVILGNAGSGSLVAEQNPELLRIFRGIETAALRAADLTRQLLAYAGKARWHLEDVDLNTVVKEAAEVLSASLPEPLTLDLDLGERVPFWRGDSTQITQVLLNLVMNAFEAFPVGKAGRIRLRTRSVGLPDGAGEAGAWVLPAAPGRYALVEVGDDGAGMAPTALQHAFEPFVTTKFTGRGLGLAVVHGILSSHGGSLWVRTSPGRGSTFRVYLPAMAEPRSEPVWEGLPAWRGAGTVLVVDPDRESRQAVIAMVRRFGFNAKGAGGGLEAMEVFRAGPGSLAAVLLDHDLLGTSPGTVLRWMREVDAGVPVFLTTPHGSMESAPWMADLKGRLGKPLRPAELLAAFMKHLPPASP